MVIRGLQAREVVRIPCIKRNPMSHSGGGDEEIAEPAAARAAALPDCGVDTAIRPRDFRIDWQRVPTGSRPLQAVLAAGTLRGVAGSVGTGRQLGNGYRRNRGFVRQPRAVDQVEIDYDGRIQQAAGVCLRHRRTGRRAYRDRPGTAPHRSAARRARPERWPRAARTSAAKPVSARPRGSRFGSRSSSRRPELRAEWRQNRCGAGAV